MSHTGSHKLSILWFHLFDDYDDDDDQRAFPDASANNASVICSIFCLTLHPTPLQKARAKNSRSHIQAKRSNQKL